MPLFFLFSFFFFCLILFIFSWFLSYLFLFLRIWKVYKNFKFAFGIGIFSNSTHNTPKRPSLWVHMCELWSEYFPVWCFLGTSTIFWCIEELEVLVVKNQGVVDLSSDKHAQVPRSPRDNAIISCARTMTTLANHFLHSHWERGGGSSCTYHLIRA